MSLYSLLAGGSASTWQTTTAAKTLVPTDGEGSWVATSPINADGTSAGNTTSWPAPAGNASSWPAPAGNASSTPGSKPPVGKTPAGKTPAGKAPAGKAPAGNVTL